MGMHSAETRLARAQRDLARAEDSLARIHAWQVAGRPGIFGYSDEEIRKAENRVYRLRARVSIRTPNR